MYPSIPKTNWRNPFRFQEPFEEHIIRPTGSPRGHIFLSPRRIRIQRVALRHRLNAQEPLAAGELGIKMGASNCPYWLDKMSIKKLMIALDVERVGDTLVPITDEQGQSMAFRCCDGFQWNGR